MTMTMSHDVLSQCILKPLFYKTALSALQDKCTAMLQLAVAIA